MSSASILAQQLSQDQTLSTILSNVTSIEFDDHTILHLSNGKPVYYTVGYNSIEQNDDDMTELSLPPPVKKKEINFLDKIEEDTANLDDTNFQDRDTPDDYLNPHPTPTTPTTSTTPNTPLFQGFYQAPELLGAPISHRSRLRKVVNATNICRDLSRRYSSF
jgi:hypothetical protein